MAQSSVDVTDRDPAQSVNNTDPIFDILSGLSRHIQAHGANNPTEVINGLYKCYGKLQKDQPLAEKNHPHLNYIGSQGWPAQAHDTIQAFVKILSDKVPTATKPNGYEAAIEPRIDYFAPEYLTKQRQRMLVTLCQRLAETCEVLTVPSKAERDLGRLAHDPRRIMREINRITINDPAAVEPDAVLFVHRAYKLSVREVEGRSRGDSQLLSLLKQLVNASPPDSPVRQQFRALVKEPAISPKLACE